MTMRLAPSSQRVLRIGLATLAIVTILVSFKVHYLWIYPTGVDLEIPLRAAERWVTGGQPYLPSSFSSPPGPTQPFLYPPYVLPLLAPLVTLPRGPLELAWCAACLLAALWALRRLAVPPIAWPVILLWPPFLEPVVGGNIQIVLFAAFVAVFYRAGSPHGPGPVETASPAMWEHATGPLPRDPTAQGEPNVRLGLLAASIGALKVSQPFPWLFLARHHSVAAVLGALPLGVIVLVSLAFTGFDPWRDWLAQLQRASDPTWELGGFAIARASPAVLGLGASLAAVAALWFVPRRDAGPWVGVLTVIGTPSLQIFGLLFLVPALLVIRREAALMAVMFIATTSYEGMWAGIVLVVVTLAAGQRWGWLREPPAPRRATLTG